MNWWPGLNRQDPLSCGCPAYWPFWEGAGDQARDIGSVQHAVNSGGVWTQDGMVFDGASNRVVVTTTTLPVVGCTIVARCRFLNNTSFRLASYGPASTSGWVLQGANGRWEIKVEISSGVFIGRLGTFDFSGDQVDVWHSVAFTVQPGATADGDLAIYVDGVQHDTTSSTSDPFQPSGQLFIGSTFGTQDAQMEVDTFSVYNQVLSAAELKALYNEPYRIITPPRHRVFSVPAAPTGFIPAYALNSNTILG